MRKLFKVILLLSFYQNNSYAAGAHEGEPFGAGRILSNPLAYTYTMQSYGGAVNVAFV